MKPPSIYPGHSISPSLPIAPARSFEETSQTGHSTLTTCFGWVFAQILWKRADHFKPILGFSLASPRLILCHGAPLNSPPFGVGSEAFDPRRCRSTAEPGTDRELDLRKPLGRLHGMEREMHFIYIYTYVYCMHVGLYVCVYVCLYILCIYIYICMYIYIYMYVYIYILSPPHDPPFANHSCLFCVPSDIKMSIVFGHNSSLKPHCASTL